MRRKKRFMLVGMEAHQNSEIGRNNEMFESVKDLKQYIQFNNYRSEYLEVFDLDKGKEISVNEYL